MDGWMGGNWHEALRYTHAAVAKLPFELLLPSDVPVQVVPNPDIHLSPVFKKDPSRHEVFNWQKQLQKHYHGALHSRQDSKPADS